MGKRGVQLILDTYGNYLGQCGSGIAFFFRLWKKTSKNSAMGSTMDSAL